MLVNALRVVAIAGLLVLSSPVVAQVTLPDGQIVPVDSGSEKQLYELFSERGEAIDWVNDASAAPDTFSPLCGFSATLVLKESGSTLAVGWYNVVPGAAAAPTAGEIFEILPAGSQAGATVAGSTIRDDPRYLGGAVGFALIRVPPHFTEAKWNTVCNLLLCAGTPGPWILSLSYASVLEDNAYYVAFEDGNTTSSGWNNDGDYNDYVFLFTGIACEGAGEPCVVDGGQGVCAPGLTECDALGVLGCKPLSQPTDEACDGVDNDCDGEVDDGDDLCPDQEVCASGNCVPHCGDEFPCLYGDVCDNDLCVHPDCAGVTCDPGQACRAGVCKAPCDGVVCPGDQVCRVGRCFDPCEGVSCDGDRVCDSGVCVLPCSCQACGDGLACDDASGRCVEPGCEALSCGATETCRAGACVDACDGAVCPDGEGCLDGECVPGAGDGGDGVDAGSDGTPGTGGGDSPGQDNFSGAGSDGGATDSVGRTEREPTEDTCGCRTVGAPAHREGPAGGWVALATLLLAGRLRRRR